MKKTKKIFETLSVFLMSAALFSFAACDNGSDSTSGEASDTDTLTFESADDAAYSVLRELADLTEFDENKAVDEKTGEVSGIEILPSDWKTRQFKCDQGFDLDNENPTVRYVAANGLDDAVEFFSSIIGEILSSDSIGDSYEWSYPGLGSLVFKPVTGDVDLFATLDIQISVLDVTQIKFVSSTYIKSHASENSYSGIPYYYAGDIIRRKKDGTLWMCVRPAGGPLKKDKSYWICLDPFKDGTEKTIFEEKKETVTVYYGDVGYPDTWEKKKKEWIYAKNLMSLKVAKAAFHTFAYINTVDSCDTKHFMGISCGIDIDGLNRNSYSEDGPAKTGHAGSDYSTSGFIFAYGKPVTDSNRKASVKDNPNTGKSSDTNLVQTILTGEFKVENGKYIENLRLHFGPSQVTEDLAYKKKIPLLSVTDPYDETFEYFHLGWVPAYGEPLDINYYLIDKDHMVPFDETKWVYDYKNFLHTYENKKLQYVYPTKTYALWQPSSSRYHVIFSPELVINDNAGKGENIKKPNSGFDDVYTQYLWASQEKMFDYWESLNETTRKIDDKEVSWDKENKE